MKFTYYNPVKIHFGIDWLSAIGDLAQRCKNERFLLVTSKSFSKRGLSQQIANAFGKQLVGIVDEILPNPQLKHLGDIASRLKNFDCIVALGGGSVIDSAKFLSVSNSSSGNHLDNLSTSLHCGARSSAPHSQGELIIQSTTANTRIVESTNPSLQGEAEAIRKNPVDCHDSTHCVESRNDEMESTHSKDSPSLSTSGVRGWVDSRENAKNTSALGEVLSSDFKGCANARAKIGLERPLSEVREESPLKSPTRHSPKDNAQAKPIYAFPTTSGTSSELTHWATIWDNDAFIKHSLSDEILYPKEAFYDPRLTLSLSRETTIHTALDALSHSFESIWNNNANPISTHYGLRSIEIILRDLPALAQNLQSLELRTSIMQASMCAGLAFSNTQTALAHALSYPLTMRFGTPHGLACSFSLPLLLECLPKQSHAYTLLSPFRAQLLEVFEALEISPNPKDYGLDSAFINEIFATLNARAKNGIFDIERVKEVFLREALLG